MSKLSNSINYIEGSAVYPIGNNKKLIIHGCNSLGYWGKGFVLAISKRWPFAKKEYQKWIKKDNPILGDYMIINLEKDIFLCNIITQKNIYPRYKKHFDEEAFKLGLNNLVKDIIFKSYYDISIHMPRIGCGLAGGKWSVVENIINDKIISNKIEVFVYTPDWDTNNY